MVSQIANALPRGMKKNPGGIIHRGISGGMPPCGFGAFSDAFARVSLESER